MSPHPTTPLGRAIRAARGDRDRTEFAAAVGIGEVTLWRYETGRRVPCDEPTIDAFEREGVDRSVLIAAARAKGCVVTVNEARA